MSELLSSFVLTWTTAGILLAAATVLMALSALLAITGGRLVIPWLVRRKLNDGEQRKASDYLKLLHAGKQHTPTMGGVFLVPAVMLSALLGVLALHLAGAAPERVWPAFGLVLFVLAGGAALGLYDDYCKLTKRGRDGLPGRVKLVAQTLVAVVACTGAYLLLQPDERVLMLPFLRLELGVWLIPLGVFVMVGAGNAFNLTDGLDGLAGGTGSIAFYALGGSAVLFAIFGGLGDMAWVAAVVGVAASGGMLGFLFWNRHPARVFMGDTGSLAFGGLLGFLAVLGRLELVLAVAGGVFVAEALSVMLQVGYFKATKGKRIFRCSPLHHHFQFGGWHETRVTRAFWKAGMGCAMCALALLPITLTPPPQPEAPTVVELEQQAPDAWVERR
jgi:phospho-N-acetylmuramoyl-pentapeptide-transferase